MLFIGSCEPRVIEILILYGDCICLFHRPAKESKTRQCNTVTNHLNCFYLLNSCQTMELNGLISCYDKNKCIDKRS